MWPSAVKSLTGYGVVYVLCSVAQGCDARGAMGHGCPAQAPRVLKAATVPFRAPALLMLTSLASLVAGCFPTLVRWLPRWLSGALLALSLWKAFAHAVCARSGDSKEDNVFDVRTILLLFAWLLALIVELQKLTPALAEIVTIVDELR